MPTKSCSQSSQTYSSPFPWTALALALVVLGGWTGSPLAQVLAQGPDGGWRTYDGPAVFTLDGSQAILPAEQATALPFAPSVGTSRRAGHADPKTLAAIARKLDLAADAFNLDRRLTAAVAWRESRFQQAAISPRGAVGVMQLMAPTARQLGADPFGLDQNILAGTRYLSQLMQRYKGDVRLTLAAYNAGPGSVDRYSGIPPFKETNQYVASVLRTIELLGSEAPEYKSGTD